MIEKIQEINREDLANHQTSFSFLNNQLENQGIPVEPIIEKLQAFQVAIPSWALGAGGTRFGRFKIGGEPATLEEKIEDVALINKLSGSANAISLHIPWDIPNDPEAIKSIARDSGIRFDAVNSNTFQDQKNQEYSYKYGSLSNEKKKIRDQAIAHNLDVIDIGKSIGSKSITIWLADGSNFPGQSNFKRSLDYTFLSLKEIYDHLPNDWKMFIEYKPYEPNFYHTVIQDWGTSFLLSNELGDQAFTLVDLGHHLPNTNIEQIVSTLIYKGKLGGFHFNDSKFGDDDLTVGSIKPYQLFLIFNELVSGLTDEQNINPSPSWMIDASHNIKDPLEDLLQSLEAILIAFAKALIIDQKALLSFQLEQDAVGCQEILQQAFLTDVRPLVKESRLRNDAAINPIQVFRKLKIREKRIRERGSNSIASGL